MTELKRKLAQAVLRSHPDRAARFLEQMELADASSVLATLAPEDAWAVMRAMVPGFTARILVELPSAARLLEKVPSQEAAAILRRLSPEQSAALVGSITESKRRRVDQLLKQRDGTAGMLADPDVLVLQEALTVGEVLSSFRSQLIGAMHELPVVSEQQKLVGMVSLQDLARANKKKAVADIMTRDFASIPVRSTYRAIAAHKGWQHHESLPVVDHSAVFIGLLKYDALRVIERELVTMPAQSHSSTSRALGDLFGAGFGGMFEALLRMSGGDTDVR